MQSIRLDCKPHSKKVSNKEAQEPAARTKAQSQHDVADTWTEPCLLLGGLPSGLLSELAAVHNSGLTSTS